ncbi:MULTISPECIES: hypothetical protein [Hyphomonas]|uniref:hypothetical protein n=1 Tax=Hyphomonas TaxID=85 RepID=UPI000C506BDD|nr:MULTISPECIES: hypothetical protein [Hyphomonas]MBB40952.1 hypothetical protein [Hyphomonas sp.]|tara:strand:+ start:3013 stop:3204 length:192 start_codon:yes stop_codon:yes gene_type:complete
MIKAAQFDAADQPVKIMSGTVRQLNANIAPGGTWREIGWDVDLLTDVPALATLAPHPDLVEPS